MRMADKGHKGMNMAEDFKDDTLICSVVNAIESWVLNNGTSFHANHSIDMKQNFRYYQLKHTYNNKLNNNKKTNN